MEIAKVDDANKDGWSSYLVWSNLYKLSPYEGGNPSDKLRGIQDRDDGCKDLLRLELETYCPRRLLLLTGMNWAKPFLQELDAVGKAKNGECVEYIGSLANDKC